jgi:tRNA (mo5U34)-methyltransferase
VWILKKIGFAKIEIVPPPADAYEQLLTGRRIVLAAHV